MNSVAAYVRIFNPTPDDDFVKKRTQAIEAIAKTHSAKKSPAEILRRAHDLAGLVESRGVAPAGLVGEMEGVIRKSSEAFVAEGQGLELLVCSMVGALKALEAPASAASTVTVLDILAVGIWLSLSFQPPCAEPGLEKLRGELLESARRVVRERATVTRKRQEVKDVSLTAPAAYDAPELTKAFKDATFATIDTLRANAAVDREEIDLLWWVIGDWSDALKARLSAVSPVAAAIAGGLEAGGMLRRLPGDAHRHIVLRNVQEAMPLTLDELIVKLGEQRALLGAGYGAAGLVSEAPAVFPLITALVSGASQSSGTALQRPLEEWAARALLESSALKISSTLPNVAV